MSRTTPNTTKAMAGTIKRTKLVLERKRAAGINAVPANIEMAGHTFEKGYGMV